MRSLALLALVLALGLLAVLVWHSGRGEQGSTDGAAPAPILSPLNRDGISSLDLSAGGDSGSPSLDGRSTPVERAALEDDPRAARAGALRFVCAATGKGVPAFEALLRPPDSVEELQAVRVRSDLEGWFVPPGWAFDAGAELVGGIGIWGFREVGFWPEGSEGPVERGPLAELANEAREVRIDAPSFVVVELPGARLEKGYAPYGGLDHREVLDAERVLALSLDEVRREGFELRGNREQWRAEGELELLDGRIVSERVVLQREARSRLDVRLVDHEGEKWTRTAEVELRSPGSSVRRVASSGRQSLGDLQPGRYELSAFSGGLQFGPQAVELLAFEKLRVELAPSTADLRALSLDLVLELRLESAAERAQLPASVRLRPSESPARAWREGPGRDRDWSDGYVDTAVAWSGSGTEWVGHAAVTGLPPGGHHVLLDPVGADPQQLAAALEETGLTLMPEGQVRVESAISGRRRAETLWLSEGGEVRVELYRRVPALYVVEVNGGATGELPLSIARSLTGHLGLHHQLGFAERPGGSIGLYATDQVLAPRESGSFGVHREGTHPGGRTWFAYELSTAGPLGAPGVPRWTVSIEEQSLEELRKNRFTVPAPR